MICIYVYVGMYLMFKFNLFTYTFSKFLILKKYTKKTVLDIFKISSMPQEYVSLAL